MKTRYIFTALLLSTCGLLFSQTKVTRDVTAFSKIDASGAATIIFHNSDSVSLTLEGNTDELARIETRVVDGTLFIKPSGNFKYPYKIFVNGNNLNHIAVSGATNFRSDNDIKSDSLVIEGSGASQLNLFINARSVRAIVSGATDADFSGSTENFYSDVSGASSLKAYKLSSAKTTVTSSGASTAKVFASQKLIANATGASTVKFKGEPKEVSAEGSTSSQIIKIAADDSQSKAINSDSTSTTFNWGRKKIIIADDDNKWDSIHNARERNQEFRHWNGFFMGVSGFTDARHSTYIPKPYNFMELDYSRSFNWQLNIWQQNIHIYKNYVNLCTGLGFDFNRYQFANKVKLNPDSVFTWGDVDSTNTFSYKKNRLSTYFVQVPLLLDFNTNANPRKSFHISLGVIGKYLLGARTKQIVQKGGDTYEQKRNDGYNINPFHAQAYASVGYRGFTVYAQYSLTEMFQHSKGPELYPFSVGVRLINFN